MTERELLDRARRGDEDAFAQLVEDNQRRLYNLALRMTGRPEDAEEVVHEAFLNAWRGLDFFNVDSTFATWVYRLTSNAAIDHLRRARRMGEPLSLSGDEEDAATELPDPDPGPQEELERTERAAALRRALDTLSPPHRQVLEMRALDGLSYEEIAQLLDLTPGTVKSRLARARLALKKLLAEDGNFSAFLSSMETEQGKGGGGG